MGSRSDECSNDSWVHRGLTGFYQWWDVMQEIALQVNRPHGWGFQKITGGEIKHLKLWQVSVGENRPCNGGSNIFPSPSPARGSEF